MLEISPVLSGTYGVKDYAFANSNINIARNGVPAASPDDPASPVTDINTSKPATAADAAPTATATGTASATEDANGVDSRRYTKFDRSAADSGEDTTFSFGDFLDMINPLQHIPVASAVYRAATGDKINPVSHVAGDLLYGSIFGGALAALGGIGSIGDAMMEAQSGKDSTGMMLSMIGIGDDKKTTQLADNSAKPVDATSTDATPAIVAEAQKPAASTLSPDQQIAAMAAVAAASTPTAANPNPAAPVKSDAVTSMTLASAPGTTAAKSFPLDRSKPYGGVMDTGNNMEAQNAAIALADASHSMRLGHTIYTNRLMNGPHPMPIASTVTPPTNSSATTQTTAQALAAQPAATATLATTAPASSPSTQHNPLPQNLMDDMAMMKALNQYRSTANGLGSTGNNLNVTN